METDAKDEVSEAIADGDKEADKVQVQVNKEDGDFDPDNAAEDEVEAVPEDEADDAGELQKQPRDSHRVVLKLRAAMGSSNMVQIPLHTSRPMHSMQACL